jgi:polyhydroxyalkanoate synthesis regulator phasin
MSDQNPFAPLMQAWLDAQTKIMAHVRAPDGDDPWQAASQMTLDWAKSMQGHAGEPIPQKVLRRMMDPARFMYAGTDEMSRSLQQMFDGSDVAQIDTTALKSSSEWLALQAALGTYRMITASAWTRAFERFKSEVGTTPSVWQAGIEPVMDQWLDIADEELMKTQASDAYLEAQREVLRAGAAYKSQEQAALDAWLGARGLPTRAEIDALHETVAELKRDIRALKKAREA